MIYLKYLSVLSFVLAMFSELIGYIWLNRLYQACQNMQNVKHKLLKQILLRFTNCARLKIRICNTPSFVKRYISNYSFAGLHYGSFEKFGVILSIAGLILTTYGTLVYSDAYYKYALISILLSIIYVLFSHFIDTNSKLEQTAIIITDYLDNTLNHRIQPAESPSSQPAATAASQRTVSSANASADNKVSDKKQDTTKNSDTNTDEIIFSVINDFLV